MTFQENPQSEEMYNENNHHEIKKVTLVSEGLMLVGVEIDGEFIGAVGTTVKAESVEMNNVKVQKGNEVMFLELGENVRWIGREL